MAFFPYTLSVKKKKKKRYLKKSRKILLDKKNYSSGQYLVTFCEQVFTLQCAKFQKWTVKNVTYLFTIQYIQKIFSNKSRIHFQI